MNKLKTENRPVGIKVISDIGRKPRRAPYRKPNSVMALEAMAIEAARKKHPSCPFLAPRKFRDDTANGLTSCIIAYLRLKGYQAERISCTGRYIDNSKVITDCLGHRRRIGSGQWIPSSGRKGSADISATINGRSVKIEVKIKDRQSKDQKAYQQDIDRAGGIYWLVRTFAEFIHHYNELTLWMS